MGVKETKREQEHAHRVRKNHDNESVSNSVIFLLIKIGESFVSVNYIHEIKTKL